jgi:hypothetical protein
MAGFDIHIDALELSKNFEQFLLDLGFWRSDFCGHPPGAASYEPPHHLTLQPSTSGEYKQAFRTVRQYVGARLDPVRGYIEGEFFAFDRDLEAKSFDCSVPAPFEIKTGFLPAGKFRESEIHVTMSRDKSDPRLAEILMKMGFFTAYLSKPYGVGQVFTVQGTHGQIQSLLPVVYEFLQAIGGAAACSIKEERVVGWWISHSDVRLPPVVEQILWSSHV